MSFARDRRLSGSSLGGLGVLGCQPVGCGGPPVRLPGTVSVDSSSFRCSHSASQLLPVFHQGVIFDRCGSRSAREGGHRTGSSFSRLLQLLFVTSKVTGGWRPVIDLSRLNRSVRVSHFHMETQQSVLQSLRPGDCMASLDLKDAYLQVPVHPESCCYLMFCVGEEVWQFRALCSGLSTAPQAFTRVMAPILSIMHRHGFRILRYLDDWLVLGSSFRDLVRARDFLWLCRELGVQVNLEKSSLTPSQTLDYLGMRLQTLPLRVFLTPKHVLKLNSLLTAFSSCQLQPLRRQLLGVMSSLASIVPGARLRMRSLQLRLNSAGRLMADSDSVAWDSSCREDLR